MDSRKPVAVIGAGLDLGQGRRGVDMGPSAIRYAELNGRLRELGLEVDCLPDELKGRVYYEEEKD